MRTVSQKLIDDTKVAQPSAQLVELTDAREGDAYLFSVPTPAQYRRFRELVSDDTTRATAFRWVADACAIEKDAFADVLTRQPGFGDTVGQKLVELAGLGVGLSVKKL